MINVIIVNKTGMNQYVDVDGNDKTEDTVIVGPHERVQVSLPNEKRFLEISKQFAKSLIVRKR